MNLFEEIADLIASSSKIAVLTGAGISTESGLPDFRSDSGFWKNNEPIQFSSFIKDERQRRLSWARNIELHKLLEKIAPNSGHELVKKIISLNKDNILITQNIDGLHQQLGMSQDQIIEIHGNARRAACLDCYHINNIDSFHASVNQDLELPLCSSCGGIVKVATISFGQPMREEDMIKASNASKTCDLMLVIGSSLKVMPAGKIPGIAINSGAKVVILNREKTRYDSKADIVINDELKNICSKLNNLF
jgi:NAD-dependent deacetylase